MTDAELLARFVRSNEQSAFAEVVRRHAGLVFGTARRLAPQDADDVAQAAFLLLSRRASKLLNCASVAGWLHEATRRCASNARRGRKRHDRRVESARRAAEESGGTRSSESDVVALLDDALARLPSSVRDVVLLRHAESLTVAETAERLGVAMTTVTKRSERGLARLRDFFASRGHATLGIAGVTTLLATESASVAPAHAATTALAAPTSAAKAIAAASSVASPLLIATTLAGAAATVAAFAAHFASQVAAVPGPTSRTTTTPAAVVGLTVEAAKATADAFFAALRAGDRAGIESLLGSDGAQRPLAATHYLAAFRGGTYAAHPSRLAASADWVVRSNDGKAPTEAFFDSLSPTLADRKHLQLMMFPRDGGWRVFDVSFTSDASSDEGGTPPRAVPPMTLPANAGFAPDGYARALAAFDAWESATRAGLPTTRPTDADGAAVVASMEASRPRLVELAEMLRQTDLSIDDATVASIAAMQAEAARRINADGLIALLKSAATLRRDPLWAAGDVAVRRVTAVGGTLRARAAVEAELHPSAPRPAAVASSIEVFVAWDGSTVAVPGPLCVPPWLRDAATFKDVVARGERRRLATRDSLGNEYEIATRAVPKSVDGVVAEPVSSIRQYRANGVLAAITRFDGYGHLEGWDEIDETGERYTIRVHQNQPRAEGVPGELQVTTFDAAGNATARFVNGRRAAYQEEVTDAVGENSRWTHRVSDATLPERWRSPFVGTR